MKIEGRLSFKFGEDMGYDDARIIAQSLEPDNLPDIVTDMNENSITVTFTANSAGTILSSVDDYLMNAIIAEKLSYILRHNRV